LRRHVEWSSTIAALAVAVLMTGCGGKKNADLKTTVEEIQAQISAVVPDTARASQIRAAYEELGQQLARSTRERVALGDRLRDLYRRYDIPRESLEVVGAQQRAAARVFRSEAMAIRDRVRSLTTEKEWKQLATGRKKLADIYVGGTP